MTAQTLWGIDDWVARLETHTDFEVKGAFDEDSARADFRRDTLFVTYYDDRADPSSARDQVLQQGVTGVAVLMAVINRRDRRGEAGQDELKAVRQAVHAAVIGWRPPGTKIPVTYRRGFAQGIRNGALWWADIYDAAMWMRHNIN